MSNRLLSHFAFALLFVLSLSCDFISPQKKFRLATARNNFSYEYSSGHLKRFLEEEGYQIEIVGAETVFDAAKMVASGAADLTLMMNQSYYVPSELGPESNKIRAVLPLLDRYFFLFGRQPGTDTVTAAGLFKGKKIGVEFLHGETYRYLDKLLKDGSVENVSIVPEDGNPDFIHFWGTYDGPRAATLREKGWHLISLNPAWVRYMQLEDPTLKAFTLPPLPQSKVKYPVNTVSSETILVCSRSLGDKAVYELSQTIFQNKMRLQSYDHVYRHIRENFDPSSMLFPIHTGVEEYLKRNEPTFLERYADTLALFLSLLAVAYGAFTAVRAGVQQRKKDRIDVYFLELLEIRNRAGLSIDEKRFLLDQLLARAIDHMTSEKIDKMDFHIFSRLIQQEIVLLR